jgi:hypothetical protein
MDFQEQLLLSNSKSDEDTKVMIFGKGLSHKLQDKLIGLKSRDLNELQNRTIEIADQLYRMGFHTKGSSSSKQNNKSQTKGKFSAHCSPSQVADAMEGVECTGRPGKPQRLGSSEYNQLRGNRDTYSTIGSVPSTITCKPCATAATGSAEAEDAEKACL